MRKLNAFALALSLITLCVTSILMLPNKAESRSRGSFASGLNPTTIYDYETTTGTGGGASAIRLSYDPVTEKLVIGLFENGDATVYVAEGVSDPVGTFSLQQQGLYDDGTGLAYAPVGSISAEVSKL